MLNFWTRFLTNAAGYAKGSFASFIFFSRLPSLSGSDFFYVWRWVCATPSEHKCSGCARAQIPGQSVARGRYLFAFLRPLHSVYFQICHNFISFNNISIFSSARAAIHTDENRPVDNTTIRIMEFCNIEKFWKWLKVIKLIFSIILKFSKNKYFKDIHFHKI